MSKYKRRRREKLWVENNGKCFYCGIDTIFSPQGQKYIEPKPNFATLDHLITTLDKKRTALNHTNEKRFVLSCLQCNNLRGKLTQIAYEPDKTKVRVKNVNFR